MIVLLLSLLPYSVCYHIHNEALANIKTANHICQKHLLSYYHSFGKKKNDSNFPLPHSANNATSPNDPKEIVNQIVTRSKSVRSNEEPF